MRLPTTIFLLALVAGLLIYVIGFERETPGTKEKLERQTRPFSFQWEEADRIKINLSDQKNILLVKKDDEWLMDAPLKDRANPELIKQLLEAVSSLEWFETFKYGDLGKGDRKDSGIDDDSTVVIVESGDRQLASVKLGGKSTIEGATYATTTAKGDPQLIHLTRSTLPVLVQVPADKWRDNKLLRIKADEVTNLTLDIGSGAMEFERGTKESPWNLIKPLRTRASDERVNAVLAAILNFDAQPATRANIPESSMPPLKILVKHAGSPEEEVITLHAAADPASPVRADVKDRPGEFFTTSRAHDFWKLQPNHLRDQNLAKIDTAALTYFRIKSQNHTEVVLEKQGENWMLKRFGTTEPANRERLSQLLERLNIEHVREFVTDAATNLTPYGLDQPFLTLTWKVKDKETLMLFGSGPENKIYARYDGEPFVYRVSPLLFNAIPPEIIRWRGLRVVNESLFAARRVIISQGESPALTLNYNPDQAAWTGETAGRDITPQINTAQANQLLQRLVSFEVSDWSADRSDAYTALKNPSLTVQLLLVEPDSPDGEQKVITLLFAPISTGVDSAIYHGRVEGDPDTFLITREQYRSLLSPLVK